MEILSKKGEWQMHTSEIKQITLKEERVENHPVKKMFSDLVSSKESLAFIRYKISHVNAKIQK